MTTSRFTPFDGLVNQAQVSDHTPVEQIPPTTPAELAEYEAASRHFWSSEECRKRALARQAAALSQASRESCDIDLPLPAPAGILRAA